MDKRFERIFKMVQKKRNRSYACVHTLHTHTHTDINERSETLGMFERTFSRFLSAISWEETEGEKRF